ncbi:uncharacterized protein MYCGRDRAFT_106284 [Zymoseptoria tritici IPO323]|uniref:Uncharacterized protein n=1 Tax=Zymoseptoria tritici (strain CBS 115943 / IPO323) TaxID=336722 RepID=F9XNF3_ZYMTI|nr:uncharacterized protein MYCGRDRAFT_106284 [Zymoseptoria tritici IPO323]EGP82861.1 hypothetical protein MYCGRDRAFT_106284 [Zymoseptoria tritici IPO323]
MAAPRTVQFIALRNLRQTTTRQAGHHQTRSLHMTGPATYASPFLSTSQTNPNVSSTHSASSKTTLRTTKPSTQETNRSRNFNTSRSRKQVNDSSPIDFTFFPFIFSSPSSSSEEMNLTTAVQVPVLPSTSSRTAISRLEQTGQGGGGEVVDVVKMGAEVYAVAPDSIILPLSDHASPSDEYMHIDFRGLADKVVDGLDGLVKDVVGGGGKTVAEAKV